MAATKQATKGVGLKELAGKMGTAPKVRRDRFARVPHPADTDAGPSIA
jgi:hypothetical protein